MRSRAKVLHFSTYQHDRYKGPKRWIRVYIHDSVEELREAAKRYRPYMHVDTTLACYHPPPHREKCVDGEWVSSGSRHFAGVIRLWADDVNAHVVSHELVHVAATIYRMDIWPNCNLGTDCFSAEEDFAYLVGDLTSSLAIVLHEARAWSTYKEDG